MVFTLEAIVTRVNGKTYYGLLSSKMFFCALFKGATV